MKTNPQIRKVASHQLMLPDGQILRQMVVELQWGHVVSYYPLKGEQAQTEWLSGLIHLKLDTDGAVSAYYNDKELL